MRSRWLPLIFACVEMSLVAAEFKLTSVVLVPSDKDKFVLQVRTKGTRPTGASDRTKWKIHAISADGKTAWTSEPSADPQIGTAAISLTVNPIDSPICPAGATPQKCRAALKLCRWDAAYVGDPFPTATNTPKAKLPNAYDPANKKDEADLYLSGAFAAGVGSNPLYTIDAKVNRFWDFTNQIGAYAGFTSSFIANEGGKLPNKRTRLDPDSIKAAATMEWVKEHQIGPIYGSITRVDLLSGEFSRKEPMSNLVSTGYLTLVLKPLHSGSGRVFVTLDPTVGVEFGRNLNAPGTLFSKSVDLNGYTAISRLVGGATAMFGVLRTQEEGRAFDVQASYRVRALNTKELMVTYDGADAVPELNAKPRYYIDLSVNAHITKYGTFTVGYKRGSLPPLFKLLDHQVSIGFTLQAKQRNKADLAGRF